MAAGNWMINVLEMLKEMGMELASFGGSLISKAYDLFPLQKVPQWIQGAVPNMKAKAREIGAENSINFLLEKRKELGLVVENYRGILMTKADEMVPALKNGVGELQIWFEVAKPYIVPVGVLLLCFYCLRRFCGGGGGAVKMMKAPGRNIRMPRASFEKNPRSYFRGLRGKMD